MFERILYEVDNRYPNRVRGIKFRRLRWAGHVARMDEGRSAFKILTVQLQERDH